MSPSTVVAPNWKLMFAFVEANTRSVEAAAVKLNTLVSLFADLVSVSILGLLKISSTM